VDMDVKINTVSAIMYGVALLLIVDQMSGVSNIIYSVALQMILLLYMIVSENQGLHAVAVPLKDLNENRLSKFECALLWIKIMEDFLEEDVMCNFVQIFNSKQLLMPNFEADPQYSVKLLPVNRNDDEPLSGIFDGRVLSIGNSWKTRMEFYRPPLDASRFGHDGQGFEFDDELDSNNQLGSEGGVLVQTVKLNKDTVQTVKLNEDTGLIEFITIDEEAGCDRINLQQSAAVSCMRSQKATVGENKYESPHMKQTQAIIKTRVHSEEVVEEVDIEHVVAADMFYGTEHPRSYGKVRTALLQ